MKEYQSNEGPPDLNDILYRHVKQMICDHTTYFLCANVSKNLIAKENIIIRDGLTEISPTNNRIIGVMVLEKGFQSSTLY